MAQYCYVTFEDLYHALMFEKACKEAGINGRLVSIPRELSAGCGYAWRMDHNDEKLIGSFVKDHDLTYLDITII